MHVLVRDRQRDVAEQLASTEIDLRGLRHLHFVVDEPRFRTTGLSDEGIEDIAVGRQVRIVPCDLPRPRSSPPRREPHLVSRVAKLELRLDGEEIERDTIVVETPTTENRRPALLVERVRETEPRLNCAHEGLAVPPADVTVEIERCDELIVVPGERVDGVL